ncbi:hypothetical protein J6590_000614 [Homalodisca vitripennis]|nr:hypothetical protein J6590_000614 [Homalodisca vitripennis]
MVIKCIGSKNPEGYVVANKTSKPGLFHNSLHDHAVGLPSPPKLLVREDVPRFDGRFITLQLRVNNHNCCLSLHGVEFRGEDLHGTSQAYNNGDLDRPTGTGLDSESHISAGSPPVPANDLFVQLRFLYSYIVVDSNCNAILPCIQITTAVTVY